MGCLNPFLHRVTDVVGSLLSRSLHIHIQIFSFVNNNSPRADGAKRRARVLIPPRLFTPGETKALAKSKVHQLSRAWVTNDVGVGGHPH